MLQKRKCLDCGKALTKIGNKRKNGKDHDDWNNREYHKQCWKRKEELDYLLKKYNLT